MSRPPSDATLLRAARSKIRDLDRKLNASCMEVKLYRVRATQAEQEVAEWKRRFDALLAREPSISTPEHP